MFDQQASVASIDLLRTMAYFVSERDFIRTEREVGAPGPWTEDEILQTYRFCNVRRKHDRVSKWIIENVINRYSDHPHLWFMICCARWINWPPTIQALMDRKYWPVDGFDPIRFGRYIDDRVRGGEKTWTGAYMITARQVPKDLGKGEFIATHMLNPLLQRQERFRMYLEVRIPQWRSVEGAMELFEDANGWGTFMTGQVVADMTYCRLLNQARDLHSYAPIGPGSTRGLNRMYGRPLDQRIPQERFNQELMDTKDKVEDILKYKLEDHTLHDWQNCFCEFDKYIRARNGTGRPRAIYKPETAF